MDFVFFGINDQAFFDFTSITHIVSGICIALVLLLLRYEFKWFLIKKNFIIVSLVVTLLWELLEIFGRFVYPMVITLTGKIYLMPLIIFFTADESNINILGDVISNLVGIILILYLFRVYLVVKEKREDKDIPE